MKLNPPWCTPSSPWEIEGEIKIEAMVAIGRETRFPCFIKKRLTVPGRTSTLLSVMKKHKFKFEITFNLNTDNDEKLDKYSITEFKNELRNFVLRYAGEEGTFYTYSKESDGEVYPTSIKVKQIKD
jgi:hypothetical protein